MLQVLSVFPVTVPVSPDLILPLEIVVRTTCSKTQGPSYENIEQMENSMTTV